MEITLNGIKVIVDEAEIARMLQERITSGPLVAPNRPPRIGERWQGGVYAGVMRGRDGEPDYHLILNDEIAAEDITWDNAIAWAKTVGGFNDYSLPTRKEQAFLSANVPEHFEPEWYWSSEQHARHAEYAWCQNFGHGNQFNTHKSSEFRARAVRRLNIV